VIDDDGQERVMCTLLIQPVNVKEFVVLKSVIKLGERPSRGVCDDFRSFVGGRV